MGAEERFVTNGKCGGQRRTSSATIFLEMKNLDIEHELAMSSLLEWARCWDGQNPQQYSFDVKADDKLGTSEEGCEDQQNRSAISPKR